MATYLEYLEAVLRRARYEQMEDGEWYASIPEIQGVWATGASVEEAKKQIVEVLDGWIDVHVKIGRNRLPIIDGVDLHEVPKRIENA